MIGLYLESKQYGISLDLLAIDGSSGVVAMAGLSGFGLPQVEVEFDSGAGDGSVFRSSRVPFRNIDIPLFLQSTSKKDLIGVANTLARALQSELTLRLVSSGSEEWSLKCRHVGGGDFAYGVDNDGDDYVTTVLQLRAGQPFWERTRSSSNVKSPAPNGRTNFAIQNVGSADAYPIITLQGPFDSAVIHTPKGENGLEGQITINGPIGSSTKVTIRCEEATVRNQLGNNLYDKVGPSPDFFALKPGFSNMGVTLAGTSSETSITIKHKPRRHVML